MLSRTPRASFHCRCHGGLATRLLPCRVLVICSCDTSRKLSRTSWSSLWSSHGRRNWQRQQIRSLGSRSPLLVAKLCCCCLVSICCWRKRMLSWTSIERLCGCSGYQRGLCGGLFGSLLAMDTVLFQLLLADQIILQAEAFNATLVIASVATMPLFPFTITAFATLLLHTVGAVAASPRHDGVRQSASREKWQRSNERKRTGQKE